MRRPLYAYKRRSYDFPHMASPVGRNADQAQPARSLPAGRKQFNEEVWLPSWLDCLGACGEGGGVALLTSASRRRGRAKLAGRIWGDLTLRGTQNNTVGCLKFREEVDVTRFRKVLRIV